MCISASSLRAVPPAAEVLDHRFRRAGFAYVAMAIVADLNAIAECGCPSCERLGTVEAMPYWKDSRCRLLCYCHSCEHTWEG